MTVLGNKTIERDAERLAVLLAGMPGVKQFYPLASPWTSTAWDGDSFSTVGTATQLNISGFSGAPADTSHIRAVLLYVSLKDSAAWGTSGLAFSCGPSASMWFMFESLCYGGDVLSVASGIVNTDANGDVWYKIAASGASTMDIWLRIWGYWT